MLPKRHAPITIELDLVSDVTAPVISTYGAAATTFKSENTSANWSIDNVQIKSDLCTLDNAFDNSYRSLPISYNAFVSQIQTISGPDVSI